MSIKECGCQLYCEIIEMGTVSRIGHHHRNDDIVVD
jgi:hypothetical protein